jgi:toxin secretion/phage lysis holin
MRALLQPVLLLVSGPRTVFVLNTALGASPWALLVRQYLFADWQFAGFLFTLILVDTITGVLRSWQKRQVSSRAFSRIFIKCLVYLLLLILAHVMTSFTIKGKVNVVFQWFDTFIYCAMMAREALSVLENLATVAPELVPKVLLKRLALFSEDPEAALRQLKPAPPAEVALPAAEPGPAPIPDVSL